MENGNPECNPVTVVNPNGPVGVSSHVRVCWCKQKCWINGGSYGKVYRGVWRQDNQGVIDEFQAAVKVVDPDKIKCEADILLKSTNHPNILKCFAALDSGPNK